MGCTHQCIDTTNRYLNKVRSRRALIRIGCCSVGSNLYESNQRCPNLCSKSMNLHKGGRRAEESGCYRISTEAHLSVLAFVIRSCCLWLGWIGFATPSHPYKRVRTPTDLLPRRVLFRHRTELWPMARFLSNVLADVIVLKPLRCCTGLCAGLLPAMPFSQRRRVMRPSKSAFIKVVRLHVGDKSAI